MTEWIVSFKKPRGNDPSAALFRDGRLVFAIEEERLSRQKHAPNQFPHKAIKACLDEFSLTLEDIDKVVYPDRPALRARLLQYDLRNLVSDVSISPIWFSELADVMKRHIGYRFLSSTELWTKRHVSAIGDVSSVQFEEYSHHACHAASVQLLDDFEEGLIITIDGKGEFDSTVVWDARGQSLERVHTYEYPNSLGVFFGGITEFLGYHYKNGEGKVMGLAPYGSANEDIRATLEEFVDIGPKYDVTDITKGGVDKVIQKLEEAFERSRRSGGREFTDWEKDLAYTAQSILEEIVTSLVRKYAERLNTSTLGMTGGVVLNCKMNQCVSEMEMIDELLIQPVAHDAGLALGGGFLGSTNPEGSMKNVYYGQEFSNEHIQTLLDENKIDYTRPSEIERVVAEEISNGNLVGWFVGRTELGPRALGHRSILADPRTEESRDRVNEYVKHREGWRPFAPSILEDAAEEYLKGGDVAPYMIQTYNVEKDKRSEIPAVLHPADHTTRPQTVNKEQSPRYHSLISEFENITGVPALLNTSFNDNGEPIVNTPKEAIKDFFSMGLDILILEDFLIRK